MNPNLAALLATVSDQPTIDELMRLMHVPTCFERCEPGVVTRAELAQALNMALFADLLERVPTGRAYTRDVA
ncbi:DUF1338 domain-containing protein, partial [Burkholderia pseudomallei]